ncbi:uncharacterized protein LOC62_03G004780 [Vanrija pseudolonga]|uniref:Uncharacterized protein n=1 Tax=Vanrija pseudolonga TaxID=143232 RepID=A0AAF0Y715_9TREE|nr:hypothetical protein LOC62_03G004780 [Vanrija pseudolonga]
MPASRSTAQPRSYSHPYDTASSTGQGSSYYQHRWTAPPASFNLNMLQTDPLPPLPVVVEGVLPSYNQFSSLRGIKSLLGGYPCEPDSRTNPHREVADVPNVHWKYLAETPTQPFEEYWYWIRPLALDAQGKEIIASELLLDKLLEMTEEMANNPGNDGLCRPDGMRLKTLKTFKNALAPKVKGLNAISCAQLVATACALWIVHPNAVNERGNPVPPVQPQLMPDGSACSRTKDIPRRVAFEVVQRIAPDIVIPRHLCTNCTAKGKSSCYVVTTIHLTKCFACKNCSHHVPRT